MVRTSSSARGVRTVATVVAVIGALLLVGGVLAVLLSRGSTASAAGADRPLHAPAVLLGAGVVGAGSGLALLAVAAVLAMLARRIGQADLDPPQWMRHPPGRRRPAAAAGAGRGSASATWAMIESMRVEAAGGERGPGPAPVPAHRPDR